MMMTAQPNPPTEIRVYCDRQLRQLRETQKAFHKPLHPGRLTWNLKITHLERNMIFQTSMIMFQPLIFQGVRVKPMKHHHPTTNPPGPRPSLAGAHNNPVPASLQLGLYFEPTSQPTSLGRDRIPEWNHWVLETITVRTRFFFLEWNHRF